MVLRPEANVPHLLIVVAAEFGPLIADFLSILGLRFLSIENKS